MVFNFDPELQATRVYQGHVRSLIRRATDRDTKHTVDKSLVASDREVLPIAQPLDVRDKPHQPREVKSRSPLSRTGADLSNSHSIVGIKAQKLVNQPIEAAIAVWGDRGSGKTTILEQMGLGDEHDQLYNFSKRMTWRGNILSDIIQVMLRVLSSIQFQYKGDLTSRVKAVDQINVMDISLRHVWYDSETWFPSRILPMTPTAFISYIQQLWHEGMIEESLGQANFELAGMDDS